MWEVGTEYIGVFNKSEVAKTYQVDLKTLGCKDGAEVKNIWTQEEISLTNKSEIAVEAHGVWFIKK